MREILFRGKRLDNGEWVYGDLVHSQYKIGDTCVGQYGNTVGIHQVNPATVGQYTGLQDVTGDRIFEGDILSGYDYGEEDGYGVVSWFDGAWEVGNDHWCGTFNCNYDSCKYEVIGNIHDNPELLERSV